MNGPRIGSSAASIVALSWAAACSLAVDGSGAGKACDDGRCALGYVCNAENRCVRDVPPSEAGPDRGGAPGVIPANAGSAASTGGATKPPATGGAPPSGSGGSRGPATVIADAAPMPDDGARRPTITMDASADAAPADAGCVAPARYFRDADGDGFGRDDDEGWFCDGAPAGWVTKGGDCDDADSAVRPGQTRYFTTGYLQDGVASFDYDCSGREEPDPDAAGAAPDCPTLALLVCTGKGYASTGRAGAGVDGTCGSTQLVSCSGLLACVPTTSVVSPKGCR
jgi:hypothetical protein